MADRRKNLVSLALTLGLVALNLAAFNVLIAGWSRARVDLTEGGQFSISEATERILQSLDDDLIIRGYFSKRTHPKLAPLVPNIADMLDEYEAVSGGRVKVEIVDPGEDEGIEQEANSRFGVQSTPFRLASKYESGIVNAYFSIVVQYADQYEKYGFDDLIEVEPLPDGDVDVRLRNLEYDLTRAIKKVVYGFRNTAELFERIQEPVSFTAIMTPDEDLPEIFQEVPQAVRDAAAELAEKAGDRFSFEEIQPVDEATQQQVAQRYGARPMSLGLFSDEQFYLYGLLSVGDRAEQIVLTEAELSAAAVREAIESSLRRMTPGFLKTVGIVSPSAELPPEVLMQYQMQGMQPPTPPPEFQQVKTFLRQDYQVQDVNLESGIPAEVDILVVLKPKDLAEPAVFQLDQYLMRGGRVVLCTDSHDTRFSQQGIQVTPISSGLEEWLAHHGITIPDEMVLDDRNRPLPVPERRQTPLGSIMTWRLAPYPYLVEVAGDGLVSPEILAGLDAVGIYWGSPVEVDLPEDSGLVTEEVLRSSDEAWTSSDTSQVGFLDYTVPEETAPRTLATVVRGRFESFFAGKEVPGGAVEGVDPGAIALETSPETSLMVVGNTEFLSDFVAQALGSGETGFFAQNLTFLENSIDWMTLDNDMIRIRARGGVARRLAQTDRATEIALETINYLVPAAVLLTFAILRFMRRRRVAPLVAAPARPEPTSPRSAEA